MTIFNPNDIGQSNGNLFGLPNKYQQAEVVVLPVPWDVTVSYGDGTSSAPERILEESLQVDLFDLDYGNFWEQGISYLKSSEEIEEKCQATRPYAVEAIKLLEKGNHIDSNSTLQKNTEKVNKVCSEMIDWVHTEALKLILDQKKVVLLGGDHSTPLGYLKALDSQNESFGILQIDAHCDLRDTYEGFEYSHASIMYNAMKLKNISSLTQVGIRDFCEAEMDYANKSPKPIHIFYDRVMQYQRIEGKTWKVICEDIINTLPQKVYISFDIDGLKPSNCPNTGTPVAGGLEIDEVFYNFNLVKSSGRKIIGMDLNEVGSEVWDANVGARVLYRMLGLWMSKNESKN